MLRASCLLLCVGSVLASASLRAAESVAPAATWVGEDAVIVLEVTRPKELLKRLFSDDIARAVTSSPIYQGWTAKPQVKEALNLVKYFEGRYGMDLRAILEKLTGGGLTLAVGPAGSVLLIVTAEDEQMLREVHEFFVMVAKNEAEKNHDADRVKSADYRGVTGWRFAPQEAHAVVGNRLVLTNKPDLLRAVVDRRAKEGGKTIAESPAYQAARKAADGSALARLYLNLVALKELPKLKNALTRNENPLGTLLVAPFLGALRASDWLSAGLGIEGNDVRLDVVTAGTAADPNAADGFASLTGSQDGALPNLTVPRQIAAVSLFRDLHRFYAAKDKLFPERTSGLIFFENMMGIFFTGRDLTEEVLAETMSDVRVVVAQQKYDAKYGTPQIQFPSAALVLRMRDPEKFRPIAEEAWQKALGLVNFTRGQQALPGLIIDRPTQGDVRYSVAAFAPDKEAGDAAVDVRFNFQPALAMPGPYLILSSTDALAQDVMAALRSETTSGAKPNPELHSAIEIQGQQLASILQANREALIRQNMVEKGNKREQSEQELSGLFTLLSYLDRVEARAGSRNGQATLQAQLTVKLP